MVNKKTVALLHAAGKVFFGDVLNSVGLGDQRTVNLPVFLRPPGGLAAAGERQDKQDFRMMTFQSQHGLSCQGVKAHGAAGQKNLFPRLDKAFQKHRKMP